jgi:ferritin-like metal-binding protein YciE
MSTLNSLDDLLAQEIKDLYSAEKQLVEALPRMADAAFDPALVEAITSHFGETQGHVRRLQEVAGLLGISPHGTTCKAMKGLIEEGDDTLEERGDPSLRDLALIVAAQKVEHYEFSGYGTAIALAGRLGLDQVAELLQATADEEWGADQELTEIAEMLYATVEESAGV